MKRAPLLLCVTLIAGCFNSDIDLIKTGRLDLKPEYTVGEAFDNRKVCKNTSWDAFKDERQRAIVEYRCYFNGYDTVFTNKAAAIHAELEELDAKAAHKREALNEKLAQAEKELSDARELLSDPKTVAMKLKAEYDARHASYTDFLKNNRNRDTDDFISNGIEIPESLDDLGIPTLLTQAKRLRDGGDDYGYYGVYQRVKSSLNALMVDAQSRVAHLASLRETVEEDTEKSLQAKYKAAKDQIASIKGKLQALDAEHVEYQEYKTQKQAEAKEILASSGEAQAYEYYRWTILDDESFMIVGGGIMEKPPGQAEFSDKPYAYPADTVALVYQDNVTGFREYKQAIGAKAWTRMLGY
ncbi:hypothetical protein S7S_11440 [Isoalcanivorax pacificus W11-5]|uniref:Lipoprotein n=1 Tax=Isoalcanivorax pacificus W11-5 TaxID=391936 RepID=A0A0B4XPN0_9GAMM|nr:hypothetical protein [Isoalcanivorax pacificus]AJD48700.1 hypothetical protein S7S_11440 [Isoalcanivorax pacificus W11-5]